MIEVNGRLEDGSGDLVKAEGCRVEALFDQRFEVTPAAASALDAPAATPPTPRPPGRRPGGPTRPPAGDADEPTAGYVVVPQRVSATIESNGTFVVRFPDRENIASEHVRFAVASPSGVAVG